MLGRAGKSWHHNQVDAEGYEELGGNGTLLQGIINALPHLQGILVEQPNLIATTEEQVASQALDARGQVRGGSAGRPAISIPAGMVGWAWKWPNG